MKKSIIITVIALFLVVGVIVTKLVLDHASKNDEVNGQPQQTEAASTPDAVPTSTPEPQESAAVTQTPEPTEAAPTEEPTEEPTATPEVEAEEETKAPEVDYSALSDSELADQIVAVITKRHGTVKAMTEKERNVYAAYVFAKEAKGGLYTYLTGSNNATAAYAAKALAAVNAPQSKELFEDFINTSRIELSNTKALTKLVKEDYHFDVFDEEYAAIAANEDLTSLVASYIKNNLDDLK